MKNATANGRFHLEINRGSFPHPLNGSQVVFHGINKSGSLAMANTMVEAFRSAGRGDCVISHYHSGGKDEEFRNRVDSAKGQPGFVVGHYLFGALAPVPNRVWITQFRHPLPRILSCYQWLKNKNASAHGADSDYPSLIEFVRKTKGVAHSQVEQFGSGYGRNKRERLIGASAADLLEIAVDELESSVYAVGIAEHFEESIFTFAALCGLDSVAPWIRDNRNKNRPLADEITSTEREVIEEVYSSDFKLYDYALDRFCRQTRELKLNADSYLSAYKAACQDQYKDRIIRA